MRPPTTVFLPALVFLVLGLAGLLTSAYMVPLEYYGAGYVKPGYEITVRLHAVGMTAMPIPVSHAFADAGVQFAGHKYGIVGDEGGGATGNVYYIIDGQQIHVDTYHYGKHEYDAQMKITAYCPGEQPSGAPGKPGPGQFWVRVEFHGSHGNYLKWNLLELGGDRNAGVPLQYFYESTPGLKSWVNTTSTVKFKDCGSYAGPDPGGDTRLDKPPGQDNHWKDLAKYLGVALVVLAVILILKP